MLSRKLACIFLAAGVLLAVGCGGGGGGAPANPTAVPPGPTPDPLPHGAPLSKADILELAALFADNPLQGGQVAPRRYKWVNENVALFVQFDKPNPQEATSLRYAGVSVKGRFCAESPPDRSFTHFDRLSAATYGAPPSKGDDGYWLSFMAVDKLMEAGKEVKPGVSYDYAATPAPSCGADMAAASFCGPGAHKLTTEEMSKLAAFFVDPILTGGQVAPRIYRWINRDVALFLQFDRGNPSSTLPGFDGTQATGLRYLGLAIRGEFCQSDRPSDDVPHFHRYDAATYGQGHGGPPRTKGIWLLWLATDTFELQGRTIRPGVDRLQSAMPIDQSC